ncbi:unnamed protein product [Rotaria sordida]|uniref:Pentatricopeptide repeat-containing protein n=1 Tax=Rotaria sordida TaxID=392033 RepID=A0A819IMJ2_9BILA|nr:unnamed protein product [Rotaria sordida]CAF3915660.1 unnamed protein product [Rotaria sordida]
MANKAIDLYNEIINPNEVIIILLFNACAQLATNETLNLIKKVFKEIPKDYHSNTGLLTSLLDALMKSGDVVYAESLLEKSANKSISMYGAMMKGEIYIFINIFHLSKLLSVDRPLIEKVDFMV